MCIVTTLNQGLRNGGGIGDILRAPSSKVSNSMLSGFSILYYSLCAWRIFLKPFENCEVI